MRSTRDPAATLCSRERAVELRPTAAYPQITSATAAAGGQPDRGVTGPAGAPTAVAGRGHSATQHQAGQDRVDQHFLADEHLGGRQQAEPGAGPDRPAAAGDEPQQRVDDQRRQHREHQVVVADARS